VPALGALECDRVASPKICSLQNIHLSAVETPDMYGLLVFRHLAKTMAHCYLGPELLNGGIALSGVAVLGRYAC
jgi:hypothetical protein